MIPLIQYSLTVGNTSRRLEVRYQNTERGRTLHHVFQNGQEFKDWFERRAKKLKCSVDDFIVMASPSVDFPEEYTRHKATLKMCRALRLMRGRQ